MKIEIHPSTERGAGEHGWLHARHSFSFASYYNSRRMGFGALRVLNEDVIEPGYGFGAHSHDNMEIVTIILEGALEHKDSAGNSGVLAAGDIQRMSAGTGLTHSEYNASQTERVHLLQIWITPEEKNIKPSYAQKHFPWMESMNAFLTVASGEKNDDALLLCQDANLLIGTFSTGETAAYEMQSAARGLFVFVVKGEILLGENILSNGDAAAVTGAPSVNMIIKNETRLLVIDVPMKA